MEKLMWLDRGEKVATSRGGWNIINKGMIIMKKKIKKKIKRRNKKCHDGPITVLLPMVTLDCRSVVSQKMMVRRGEGSRGFFMIE